MSSVKILVDESKLDKKQRDCIFELEGALDCTSHEFSSDIVEVVWYLEGHYEDESFHWVVELKNGKVAFIKAHCGAYTGWEIGGDVSIVEYDNYDDLVSPLNMPEMSVDGELLREPITKACFHKLFDEQVNEELKDEE